MARSTTVKCDLCDWSYTGVDARVTYRTHLRTEHRVTESLQPAARTTYHQEHFAAGLTERDREMLKLAKIDAKGF